MSQISKTCIVKCHIYKKGIAGKCYVSVTNSEKNYNFVDLKCHTLVFRVPTTMQTKLWKTTTRKKKIKIIIII